MSCVDYVLIRATPRISARNKSRGDKFWPNLHPLLLTVTYSFTSSADIHEHLLYTEDQTIEKNKEHWWAKSR